jgi:carboxyl-terminal processing protease
MVKLFRPVFVVLLALAGLLGSGQPAAAQKMDGVARGQVSDMLKNVKSSLRKDYYATDISFGNVDFETRFKQAEERLKAVDTLGQAFGVIAQVVLDLNDSHTRFYPPSRAAITEYGWRMRVIGDKAFITAVQPGSDGEAKGLKAGDEVLAMNGFPATRRELWKMIYYYQTLNPQLKITLDVKSPAGEVRKLDVMSKVTPLKRVVDLTRNMDISEAIRESDRDDGSRHYFKEVGGAYIWKMPDFVFDPKDVKGLVDRFQGKQTVIFDLRGNPGGLVVTLEELAGYFFDKEVKIADLKGRKPMDPQVAKPKGKNRFEGKVIVLLDSGSASAAEIFGRLMQIEKRGIVVGDVSSGAVMQSRGVSFDAGVQTIISYGMNLTNADVIMTDGKSLEHVGVIPDELVLPTGKDLAEGRDPVLARALEIAGVKIDSADAGRFFPTEKFFHRISPISISFEF